MELPYSPSDRYCDYLFNKYPDMDAGVLGHVEAIAESTNWENPASSRDWNNLAIIELIESEQSEDLGTRATHVQMAMEYLEKGFNLDGNPLCAAHYALIQCMTNESGKAINLAFNSFLNTLQPAYTSAEGILPGLIYLPSSHAISTKLELILKLGNGYKQSLVVLSEVLWRSQLVFYSHLGIRFLQLANQVLPDITDIQLRLGIAYMTNSQPEGIFYLHQARQLEPNNMLAVQALHLAYRTIGDVSTAGYWQEKARDVLSPRNSDSITTEQWAKLEVNSDFTYVSFDQDLILAVEPCFKSIVTSVLVAERDWFEHEMEFWRNWIQPGMTVIDVGANAGVYTFSAANAVGSTGLVLAVEPFSKCVGYLRETCRLNKLDWVKVCAGAASDRNGKAKLSLSSASELNELIPEGNEQTRDASSFEEVECFTLDSLIDKYGVSRVDFLKIDAEGHELQVLKGSDRILTEFAPIILYENIAGSQGSNLPVADFLRSIDYRLFCYQPYLQKLVSVDVNADFQDSLNVIALPQEISTQLAFSH